MPSVEPLTIKKNNKSWISGLKTEKAKSCKNVLEHGFKSSFLNQKDVNY